MTQGNKSTSVGMEIETPVRDPVVGFQTDQVGNSFIPITYREKVETPGDGPRDLRRFKLDKTPKRGQTTL